MTQNPLDAPVPASEPERGTWRLVDVLLITVVSVLLFVGGSVAFRLLKLDDLTLSLGAAALEAVVLIGCVALLGLWRRRLPWQAVGLRPAPSNWVWVAIAAGILCIFLTGMVALGVQMLLGQAPTNPQLPFLLPQGLTPLSELVMFLLAGLAIPFAEELFFRGVLYTWLRQHFGFWVSALASAVIFGAAHGDIAIAAGVAVMGVLQAWVFERSRSLWTTFLIHAINNSFKLILLYALLALGLKLTS